MHANHYVQKKYNHHQSEINDAIEGWPVASVAIAIDAVNAAVAEVIQYDPRMTEDEAREHALSGIHHGISVLAAAGERSLQDLDKILRVREKQIQRNMKLEAFMKQLDAE